MASTTIPATSSELLARVDVGWRPLREAVRGLGRARLDERAPTGWSYHDLLAHIAAWEDLTARRLRTLRETGQRTQPAEALDIDGFNARIVETHRLVGAEALVDELDTSHRALRRELEQLTDVQIQGGLGWAVVIVAGSSYGHYAEHAAELDIG
ncbi:MAG TPA: DinB family protein [Candidatus Limnocylindria bacterium]|nr:DinB family protein [Candidatus Limnocylindria bacterium]